MKKKRTFPMILGIVLFAPSLPAQESDTTIQIGERHRLQSEVLGEERPYWVYLPASYDDKTFGEQAYPVLYLLDGDAHFHSVSGVVQFMGTGINGNIQIPELIVVAIPNTNRTRDLTPTNTSKGYDGKDAEFLKSSGGGDAFLRFIQQELFPQIESSYRTKPFRMLVGHSFGGLLALHAFLEAPAMFQATVAIDPSLWWDDQILVTRLQSRISELKNRRASVYISLANSPDIGNGNPGLMRGAGQRFSGLLQTVDSRDLTTRLDYYEREDHGSVPLLSLYHGLLHTFAGYKPVGGEIFTNPASLVPHFQKVSERLGVQLQPPPRMVEQLAFFLLGREGGTDKALQLLEVNVSNFPESSQVYQSLAVALSAKGDKEAARRNLQKALSLDPDNERAAKQLKELNEGSQH